MYRRVLEHFYTFHGVGQIGLRQSGTAIRQYFHTAVPNVGTVVILGGVGKLALAAKTRHYRIWRISAVSGLTRKKKRGCEEK